MRILLDKGLANITFRALCAQNMFIGKKLTFFAFFRPTQKMGPDGPKWGQEDFFLANPDLADILGRTDLDFENSYFLVFF